MVKYVLKGDEKFIISDELYEELEKNGNSFMINEADEDNSSDDEELSDIDITKNKRYIFVTRALKQYNIPLGDKDFQELVTKEKAEELIKAYNKLYFCGETPEEAERRLNRLKNGEPDMIKFTEKRDKLTQKLFNKVTKDWLTDVKNFVQTANPKVRKKFNGAIRNTKEADKVNIEQVFAAKGRVADAIKARIKNIMKRVGKFNKINYVFSEVRNINELKKYYFSALSSSSLYGYSEEEANEIKREINQIDGAYFQKISDRLLVHGDVNEYIRVIREDDMLDDKFTVSRSERPTTLGQQKSILIFKENSSQEVMYILVIEPTFGALKQFLQGIDIGGLKSSWEQLSDKM